jgi:hypothetical protein
MAIDLLAERWANNPPPHPILIAGSTGSRGATLRLMEMVARLPQGALVLPGFDFDMPRAVWDQMDDVLTAEDHPQYRFRRLLDRLELTPGAVQPWIDCHAPSPARNALVSLALRPAPVTDQWLSDGPKLPDLMAATADVALIEAPSVRIEALAIALILRQAAEDGTTGDAKDNFAESSEVGRTGFHGFHLEAERLRVATIHAVEIGGEKSSLRAAGASPNFHNGITILVRFRREEGDLQGAFEFRKFRLQT